MNFHTNGLTSTQLQVITETGRYVTEWGFYLAGGTAISIYYGHRQSVDLDWFTSTSLLDPLQLAQSLRDEEIPFITENTDRGTLYGTIEGIQLSFFEFRYELLQPLTHWEEGNCMLASLDDLACMKLSAVAQRGSRKDFIDVYSLVKEYKPLDELLSLYQKKFRTENIAPVLLGLVYFDDAEDESDPLLWSGNWKEVKREISYWVHKI